LRTLEMLPGAPEPAPAGQRRVGSFIWLRSSEAGWWEWSVDAGDEVGEGDVLGRVRDLWGALREEIVAPRAGVVLFVTSSPAGVGRTRGRPDRAFGLAPSARRNRAGRRGRTRDRLDEVMSDAPTLDDLNARHGTTFRAGGRYDGGEVGAARLVDAEGRRFVLK